MEGTRRRFLTTVGTAGVVGVAGCTGGPTDDGTETEDDGTPTDGDGTPTEAEESATRVGMVYATGGLGDGSFNDQAQQGLFEAEGNFEIAYQEAQPDSVGEFGNFQQQFAESTDPDYDLICCIGFLQTDALSTTAENYPDQQFMLVDSVVEAPNVASYVFKEEEGSFLVGQLAGLLTTSEFSAGGGATDPDSTTVGFVGGVESDLIAKFEAGFTAGVNYASEDLDVLTNYVGDFNEPAGGKEAALSMFDSGADVVYHAAGNTGTGVFQAAQERGRFAIGVDRDQSVTKESYADVILASMVKRVDTAVYEAIEAAVEGTFEGGTVVSLGLEQDGVDIIYGQQLGAEVSADVKDAIATSRRAIVDGDISVPTDPDDA
jgi:basic membrane protein A